MCFKNLFALSNRLETIFHLFIILLNQKKSGFSKASHGLKSNTFFLFKIQKIMIDYAIIVLINKFAVCRLNHQSYIISYHCLVTMLAKLTKNILSAIKQTYQIFDFMLKPERFSKIENQTYFLQNLFWSNFFY